MLDGEALLCGAGFEHGHLLLFVEVGRVDGRLQAVLVVPVDSDDAVDVRLVANLGRHAKPPDLLLNSEYLLDVCVVVVVDADDMLWRPVIDVHVALLHSGRHLEIQKTLQSY